MADNVYALLQQAWSVSKTSDANMYGVEVAIVTNVKDPDKQGRVKICFPRLPGKPESDWARVVQPAAGQGRGFYWLPEVNDEVLVAFERGQANVPYVIGALWNGKDKPMKDAYTDDNTKRLIQTKSGHQILFEDKSGDEKISIADKSGKRTLTFDVKNKKFLVEAKEGDVEIHAKKKLVLQCEDLEIKTSKTGKITIGSKFDLKVADKASFKAGPKMDIKADKVNLNPPSLSLEALVAAAAGAIAGAAAGAAAGGAAGAAAGAQAGAMAGFEAGSTVPTTDVLGAAGAGAAAGGAAGAAAGAAGAAGAAAPGGSAWTTAGAGGAAGAVAGGAAAGAAGKVLGDEAGKAVNDGGKNLPGGKTEDKHETGPSDVDITLQDASGQPVSGLAWKVTLPDGAVKSGTTGDDGKISIKGLKGDGEYKLVLPDLDKG